MYNMALADGDQGVELRCHVGNRLINLRGVFPDFNRVH
jgi:hypothetical protein